MEMLAAITVFVILALMVSRLVSGTSMAIIAANKSMDADSQARFVFGLMAQDFNKMLKRNDVDMIFSKQTGNDKMFFYSEVLSSYDSSLFSTSQGDPKNPVSLIGYRVEPDPTQNNKTVLQLERLGKGLTWDESVSASGGSVVFLTYQSGTGALIPQSTLDGHWQTAIGQMPLYNGATSSEDLDYHVIGDQVFRFEYCFLLNDGTYSNYPVKNLSGLPATITAGAPNNTYKPVGTRWFDTDAGRAYVCTSQSADGANSIWRSAGLQDVSAIVVAIAILDQTSRKIVTDMTSLPSLFQDPDENADLKVSTPNQAVLMEQKWKTAMESPNFVRNAGIPVAAAGQIKIYQRYFYLNSPQ